ncbi:MAG: hypothetical protein MUE63_02215 [Xanthomonadales bacterium]|jgi:hypothetical protein|nr:hypothetical protein [Xanthomonadales bacterium]
MNSIRIIWLSVAAGLVLAACNPAEEPAAPGAPEAAAAQAEEPAAIDACAIVTAEDAAAVFGQPASPDTGHGGVTMIAQCLWTWDTESSNQLLQFHIWDPRGYEVPEGAQPLDLGDGGYVLDHPLLGVDIAWLQGGRHISLAYSTVGPDAPESGERVKQMVALARQVAERL